MFTKKQHEETMLMNNCYYYHSKRKLISNYCEITTTKNNLRCFSFNNPCIMVLAFMPMWFNCNFESSFKSSTSTTA